MLPCQWLGGWQARKREKSVCRAERERQRNKEDSAGDERIKEKAGEGVKAQGGRNPLNQTVAAATRSFLFTFLIEVKSTQHTSDHFKVNNHHHCLVPKHFHHPRKKPCAH